MRPPFRVFSVLGLLAVVCVQTAQAETARIRLEASVKTTVTSSEHFLAFGENLARRIDTLQTRGTGDSVPSESLLLAMRVHLALSLGEMDRARAISAQIREAQKTPEDRAFAGLLTESFITAYRATHSVGPLNTTSAAFQREMATALKDALAALPRTRAMREVLQRQTSRIAGLSQEILLAETDHLASHVGNRGSCTWEEADQVVRLGHRLRNLVPVRETVLEAFAGASALRANDL